jgi:hypothetical protein
MLLVDLLSSNTHDKSVEAAMSSAFFYGPIAAAAAFLVVFFLLRARGAGSASG